MIGMTRRGGFRVEHSTRVLRSATRRTHRRDASQLAKPVLQRARTRMFAAGRRVRHSGRVLHPASVAVLHLKSARHE